MNMSTFAKEHGHVQYRSGLFKAEPRCDFPGCTPEGKTFVIDHCHEHGWIRGNVCASHNGKLGYRDANSFTFNKPKPHVVSDRPGNILGLVYSSTEPPQGPDDYQHYQDNCPDCAIIKRWPWGVSTKLSLITRPTQQREFREYAPDSIDAYFRFRQRKSGLVTPIRRSKEYSWSILGAACRPLLLIESVTPSEYSIKYIEYEGSIHAVDKYGIPLCGAVLTRPVFTSRLYPVKTIMPGKSWRRPTDNDREKRRTDICEDCAMRCSEATEKGIWDYIDSGPHNESYWINQYAYVEEDAEYEEDEEGDVYVEGPEEPDAQHYMDLVMSRDDLRNTEE